MVGKRKKVKLNLTRDLVTFGSLPATSSDVMSSAVQCSTVMSSAVLTFSADCSATFSIVQIALLC